MRRLTKTYIWGFRIACLFFIGCNMANEAEPLTQDLGTNDYSNASQAPNINYCIGCGYSSSDLDK